MKTLLFLPTFAFLLVGCSASMMETPVQPVRPIISCTDCKGLVYYGEQQPAPEAPGVSLARVLTDGVSKVALGYIGADLAKSVVSTVADSGKQYSNNTTTTTTTSQSPPVVVEQPNPLVVKPEVVNPQVVNPQVVRPEVIN